MQIEVSETMKSIWVTMMRSKDSAQPANSMLEGLLRINKLTYDFVKEHYGPAAIEVDGRYYTPDCKIIKDKPKSASELRQEIKARR